MPARAALPVLLAEAEVYRVLASSGRTALPGVYELAHPLAG